MLLPTAEKFFVVLLEGSALAWRECLATASTSCIIADSHKLGNDLWRLLKLWKHFLITSSSVTRDGVHGNMVKVIQVLWTVEFQCHTAATGITSGRFQFGKRA